MSDAKCWRCIVTAPKSFTNRSKGISRWFTSPEAVLTYTYIPADSELPPLRGQEEKGDEAVAYVKLFNPSGGWTWYLTEADRETGEAFGYVVGHEPELGYVDLNELSELRVRPFGLPIERDRYFKPTTIRALREVHER